MIIDSKLIKIFKFLFLQMVMTGSVNHVCAYDFKVDGIFYNVLPNGNSVSVTYGPEGNNSYIGQVEIPSIVSFDGKEYKVTSIGENAFENSSDMKSVIIPNSVTKIGKRAFYRCSVHSVTIGAGVSSIGEDAFYGCKELFKVIMLPNIVPSGLQDAINVSGTTYVSNSNYSKYASCLGTIKEYKYLSSWFYVDGVRYVPVSPSDHTCDVVDFDYNYDNDTLTIPKIVSNQGIELNVINIEEWAFYKAERLKDISINNTGRIKVHAFSKCSCLRNVDMAPGVTYIDVGAFYEDDKLLSIKLPSTLKTLMNEVFYNCKSLLSIDLPDKLELIGHDCFYGCSSLSEIIFPPSVTTVGIGAFLGCSSLSKVTFIDGSMTIHVGEDIFYNCPITEAYIGRNISSLLSYPDSPQPFYLNKTLKKLTISDTPNKVADSAFYGCTSLLDVSIGDRVSKIGKHAFYGCVSMRTCILGEGVIEIGEESFSDCTEIAQLVVKASTPPICGKQALDDINKWNCKLYIPAKVMGEYKCAPQWKDFFFYEPLNNFYEPENVLVDRILYLQMSETTVSVKLSDSPKVTFPNGTLTLSYNDTTSQWAFEDFTRWYFENVYSKDPLGINDIESNDVDISMAFSGNTLWISAGNKDKLILCDITGNILVSAIGSVDIDMSNYPTGVYIAKSGNKSVKFIKK